MRGALALLVGFESSPVTREGLEPGLFDGNQRLALRSSNSGHLPRRQYDDVTRVVDAFRNRV